MSNRNARAHIGQDRANLYNEITDKIIAEHQGLVPGALGAALGYGRGQKRRWRCRKTRRRSLAVRQCINVAVLILWGAVIERGFSGQAGSPSARRSRLAAMSERANTAPRSSTPIASWRAMKTACGRNRRGGASRIPFLKRFTVFNTGLKVREDLLCLTGSATTGSAAALNPARLSRRSKP